MAVIVTGGAGFVAANLIPKLLESGERVLALDSCTRGDFSYLNEYASHPALRKQTLDLADLVAYERAMEQHHDIGQINSVWHLAANSDIPAGISDPDVDLRDTFMTTFNTLRIMESRGIARMNFASSSAVYGNHGNKKLTEDGGPLLPISNYGAMKLASEAALSAAAEKFVERVLIFRFPNVVGTPATHGVLLDFITRLRKNPNTLKVLGNGSQRKSYLHVSELVDAMLFLDNHSREKIGIYNIGPRDDGVTVRQIAEETVACVAPGADIQYGFEAQGWVGDVPRFAYSIERLESSGWHPKMSSIEAIRRSILEISGRASMP